jgi:hypothetical protein
MYPLLLAVAPLILAQAADESPPGRRINLGEAMLFIPDGYRPEGGRVDLVLHMHGAARAVEPALIEADWRAVLVEFNRKGLSRVYAEPFADPELFPALLEKARKAVQAEGLAPEATIGRVAVSSFSAGFGGVRELLKVPAHFDRIDALFMADSLYAGYAGDPAEHRIDPKLLAGFERFAAEAAAGRKTFVLTHSAQVPEGYASTTETADDLIRSVGGRASPARDDWGGGWTLTRRFEKGRFLVLGFAGREGDDHLRHLRGIAKIWKAAGGPFRRERP